MEGEIGGRKERLGSKGRDPQAERSSPCSEPHRAVNPLSRPRSPRSSPRALLSAQARGRDPAEGDTAPRADGGGVEPGGGAWLPPAPETSPLPGLAPFRDPQDPGLCEKGSRDTPTL